MRIHALRSLFVVCLLLAGASAEGRVAVFRAPGFPTVDARPIAPATLDAALKGIDADVLASVEDFKRVKIADHDVLLLPYGSAFPAEAWPEIRAYVKSGGSLVVLGGAPFHQPVRRSAGGEWNAGIRQPSYAHDLLIGPAEAVLVDPSWKVAIRAGWSLPVNDARTVWELTVRLSTRPEFPSEHGSEGPREGIVRPLVHLISADGTPRACPLVEIDRLRGEGAGGRWIFATSDATLDAAAIRAMVLVAREGASELDARPEPASVHPGEIPSIRITLLQPRLATRDSRFRTIPAEMVVRDDSGREVHRGPAQLTGTSSVAVPIGTKQPMKPGLYRVVVTAAGLNASSGFWIRDDALLKSGPKLTVSRDWLRKDGRVFPVVGTTYMASDVHRQFLFEPNPAVWDRDFAQMKRFGVNFVRTGLWTAWSRAMEENGAPREPFLRALEAYVQSAAKHGIVVNFTFFAFLPSAHGGTNPYLDPRSLEGQETFVGGVAGGFRDVGWIHYDLINEPSYAPLEGLWSNRPIRDEWERRAWREWVGRRHGDDPERLRERWRITGDEGSGVRGQGSEARPADLAPSDPQPPTPDPQDLYYSQIRDGRHPRMARDFAEFSHEAVAGWAARLRDAIRREGGEVLVTLGQDEGGTGTRPSQQLHAASVDYTCIHPWWQNDDVLANGVFTKVPEKPNLFQETGLMRLENLDGTPWRSPDLAAAVLGRKFALAFAARAAGAVEWAWNINPYMPIDNESVIGFFRPDGTAKPESSVVPKLAEFFTAATPWLDDFEPDPVVVVIPQARLFMARPAALDGARRVIRVLAERFGVVPTAISDLRLTAERLRGARLVILPSVEFLDGPAADAVAAAARSGTKVLVTGAITGDSYGEVPLALRDLADAGRPVLYREPAGWSTGLATFDNGMQEFLLRSSAPGRFDSAIWHEPLPLEYAREDAPIAALLEGALKNAKVEVQPSDVPVTTRLLTAPRAVLAVVINETGVDQTRHLTVAGAPHEITVPVGGWALVLFDRSNGAVLARAGG